MRARRSWRIGQKVMFMLFVKVRKSMGLARPLCGLTKGTQHTKSRSSRSAHKDLPRFGPLVKHKTLLLPLVY
jgi:hypothetical protein